MEMENTKNKEMFSRMFKLHFSIKGMVIMFVKLLQKTWNIMH